MRLICDSSRTHTQLLTSFIYCNSFGPINRLSWWNDTELNGIIEQLFILSRFDIWHIHFDNLVICDCGIPLWFMHNVESFFCTKFIFAHAYNLALVHRKQVTENEINMMVGHLLTFGNLMLENALILHLSAFICFAKTLLSPDSVQKHMHFISEWKSWASEWKWCLRKISCIERNLVNARHRLCQRCKSSVSGKN